MTDQADRPTRPFDRMAYGPKVIEIIDGMFQDCETGAEAQRLMDSFVMAAGVLKKIEKDSDAIALCLFIGYAAGVQNHGAVVLPLLLKALEAGYEGAFHEEARKLEGEKDD